MKESLLLVGPEPAEAFIGNNAHQAHCGTNIFVSVGTIPLGIVVRLRFCLIARAR